MLPITSRTAIAVLEHCEPCRGSGFATVAIWKSYWTWARSLMLHPTPAEQTTWWAHHGYRTPPPDEPRCAACEGTGRVTRSIPLTDFAHALLRALAD